MKSLIAVAVIFGSCAIALAQKPTAPVLQSLVDTERAFARTSEEKGTRPSFMEFIAEDGILFRPGAVKGKQWMMEHPLPPSNKRPVLSWRPAFAVVSRAGDLGYTTGPWEFKSDVNNAKAEAFGNFITVWKRQPDGTWKFAVDLGISNPEPAQPVAQWALPANYREASKGSTVKVDTERAALLERERAFASASEKSGARKAFESFAADDVRVFREEKFPFVGKINALEALSTAPNSWTWQPLFGDVSRSGDLGYSYGTYSLTSADAKIEKGNYLRIWQKRGGVWRVVVDVANPLPPG